MSLHPAPVKQKNPQGPLYTKGATSPPTPPAHCKTTATHPTHCPGHHPQHDTRQSTSPCSDHPVDKAQCNLAALFRPAQHMGTMQSSVRLNQPISHHTWQTMTTSSALTTAAHLTWGSRTGGPRSPMHTNLPGLPGKEVPPSRPDYKPGPASGTLTGQSVPLGQHYILHPQHLTLHHPDLATTAPLQALFTAPHLAPARPPSELPPAQLTSHPQPPCHTVHPISPPTLLHCLPLPGPLLLTCNGCLQEDPDWTLSLSFVDIVQGHLDPFVDFPLLCC